MLTSDPLLSRHCRLHNASVAHDALSNCWFVQSTFNLTATYNAEVAKCEFMNSVEFLVDDAAAMLDAYSFVMRTDADTFVTPAFVRWRPTQFHTGVGAYCHLEGTQKRLVEWAGRLGVRHRGMHNLGASWYGAARDIRRAARLAARLTAALYEHAFDNKQNFDGWPLWHYGVALLYGSELALNELFATVTPTAMIDTPTDQHVSVNSAFLYHSYQTGLFFSKLAFAKHSYDGLETKGLPSTDGPVWALEMAWRGNGIMNRTIDDYIRTFPEGDVGGPSSHHWFGPMAAALTATLPVILGDTNTPIGEFNGLCKVNFTCNDPNVRCFIPSRFCMLRLTVDSATTTYSDLPSFEISFEFILLIAVVLLVGVFVSFLVRVRRRRVLLQ